ncbi:ATP-dependent zinc protease [Cellvibrio sp. NN19]|uniref:ATP-dependent zinc protease family protein n=1 Tax=Cellvibrio chitinivorans TaxID=3102792 RepID=UPI002B4059C5|nr:ATP-dependent zinc protease [Cellvibrio sp. NN19]
MTKQPEVIGWREWVGLPDLGVTAIKAKVDTGARTSALHAYYVTPFDKDGKQWVRFGLHPLQLDSLTCIECEAPVKDTRVVRDSGGHSERRFVIDTCLLINGISMSIEVTLTDRENMRFRMLLGRSALKRGFWVDSSKSFLLGGNKNQPAMASL